MKSVLVLPILILALISQSRSQPMQQPIWSSGEDGYDTYRIPALSVSTKGTLLAFCEGRKSGRGDSGDIDLLIKRSTDKGRSWSRQQVIWDDTTNTCGNPCPVVDKTTGVIWLLMTWNLGDDHEPDIIEQKSKDTRRIFITSSDDDGRTWKKPHEITTDVKLKTWTWYATGPGAGIQIEKGPYKGRLVVPCDHIEAGTKHYYSHVIYSDDHGKSWKLGGSTPEHQVNECQVVELSNSHLMLNMRNYDRSRKKRQSAVSRDGGQSWQEQRFVSELIEPICQASLRRFSWPESRSGNIILFSNPADEDKRINMTVRLSHDDGATWPTGKSLTDWPSAYSDLAVIDDTTIACLYETGSDNPYETITLAKFSLTWLLEDQ